MNYNSDFFTLYAQSFLLCLAIDEDIFHFLKECPKMIMMSEIRIHFMRTLPATCLRMEIVPVSVNGFHEGKHEDLKNLSIVVSPT